MKIPKGATYSYQSKYSGLLYYRLANNRVQYYSNKGVWLNSGWRGGVKAFLSNDKVKKLSVELRVFKYDHS